MKDESKAKLAEAGKGTARGGGSVVSWGYVAWVVLVDKAAWSYILDANGRPDGFTFIAIGIIGALITFVFRLLENRYPWMSVLLFSKGAPLYEGAQGERAGATVTVTTPDAQVEVSAPDPAPQPAVLPPVEPEAIFGPGAWVHDDPATPAVAVPPPYTPPPPITALDDPESLDTSAVLISTDPDDLLDGGTH